MKRILHTLSEPRYASAAAVTAYSLAAVLGILLMTQPQPNWVLQYVPGGLLILGSLVAIPAAWVGGFAAAYRELGAMLAFAGGFATGLIVEISDLAATGDTATLWLEFLLILVLIGAGVRAVYLKRRYFTD